MTDTALAAAFTEWMRRYNEEPERFGVEFDYARGQYLKAAGEDVPEEYGPIAAVYLLSILAEQA